MPSLLELQHGFADAVFGSEAERFHAALVSGQGAVETAFGIYRSSVLGNYRKVLGAIYPVVERLVGERFFSHAATAFAKQTPSSHGDLNRYGEAFADFLTTFPGADQLAYLPDVARLEWAVESVFHAADPSPPEVAQLACLADGDQDEVRFRLGDHCRLLRSPWPVNRLWELNQPGVNWDDAFSIDSGPVNLLVRRSGFECVIEHLKAAEYDSLLALREGSSLAEGCAQCASQTLDQCGEFLALRLVQGDLTICR